MIRLVFERLGLRTELDGDDVIVPGGQRLVVQADFGEYKRRSWTARGRRSRPT